MKIQGKCLCWSLAALAVLAWANVASAQNTFWSSATDGSWFTAGNWDAGVPGASTAVIGTGAGTVTIDGPGAFTGNVFLGFAGGGNLVIDNDLTIGNGTTTGVLHIGHTAGASNASTVLQTGGTVLGGQILEVGDNADGTFTITGGTYNTQLVEISAGAGDGTLNLFGGTLNITFDTSSALLFDNFAGNGSMEVAGSGTLTRAGDWVSDLNFFIGSGDIFTNEAGKVFDVSYDGGMDLTTMVLTDLPDPPAGFFELFNDSGPGALGDTFTGIGGGEFVTSSETTEITKLGLFDRDFNGLNISHEVVLWDVRTQTIVAQVTVPAGTSGELIGEFRYADLGTAVTLDPYSEYRLVATWEAGSGDSYRNATTGAYPDLSSLPGLDSEFSEYVFGRGRFLASGTASDYPTGTTGAASTVFGPVSFIGRVPAPLSGLAAGTSVPEPTSGLLFVSALTIAGLWSRRNRPALDARIGMLGAALVVMLLMSPTAMATHGGSTPAGFTDAGSAFTMGGDSTVALQMLLDTEDNLFIPNMGSDWGIGQMFLIRDNQNIIFEDGVVMQGLATAFTANTNDSLFQADDVVNVSLTGYGAAFSMENVPVVPAAGMVPAFESRHGLRLQNVLGFDVTGLTIRNTQGDGIYISGGADSVIGFSQNVTIQDVTIDDAFRNGISVISVQGLLIDNATIVNTVGTSPRAGIDFEPNSTTMRIVDATVRNSIIMANGSDGIIWGVTEGFQARPVSGLIENVTVLGNSRYGFGLDGNAAYPAGGALPSFEIKDSLVVNNSNGGLQVVAGAGTQTIDYSAFSGNGGGGDLVGAAAFGTGNVTGTAPVFVSTNINDPLFGYLDPTTSTLISLGDSDGSFIGARGVAGDFDADAGIDGFDFLAWQRGESPNNGSANDLAAWEQFFGATGAPLSGLAASVGAVPEPSTAVLFGLALAGLATGRRRRR